MKKQNETFLDPKTLMAILLVGATFFGWQWYMQKKYPQAYHAKPDASDSDQAPANEAAKTGTAENATEKTGAPEVSPQVPSGPEETVPYTSSTLAFDISSRGMGLKSIKILKYKDRKGETVEVGKGSKNFLPLETRLKGHQEALNFEIKQVNPNLFVGHARAGGMTITKTMEIDPDKYLIKFKVTASGSDEHFVGLATALSEEVEPKAGGMMRSYYDVQEFFVETTKTHDRVTFGKSDETKTWDGVKLASIGSQYFTQALMDNSPVIPEAKAQLNQASKVADLLLEYPILDRAQDFQLSYSAFVGPKSMQLLHEVDNGLEQVVDFGFFNWIGKQLLVLLKAFYAVVGNWGLAIILLTFLIRLLVMPVNLYSYKSMKAMQTLQPQIKAIKEKYKDDQQKQQQETMALMRTNKVNPLGGCLPMLLQVPIFFALYRVLGNSIELYQAPFVFWIHDLSLKDPYYILPALMGIAMFIQQKVTPTATVDPAQQKIMLMMPIVFTFFMVSLPSGLTLYMLVGSVFSVAQQTYFMRTKTLSSGAT